MTPKAETTVYDAIIVDDSIDTADMYHYLLNSLGYKARVFHTATEAIEWLDHPGNATKLVLMDLSMPTIDGLTAAEQIRINEQIRKSKHPVKIAFLTACTIDSPILDVAHAAKVRKIFIKNGDVTQFAKDVKELIGDVNPYDEPRRGTKNFQREHKSPPLQ